MWGWLISLVVQPLVSYVAKMFVNAIQGWYADMKRKEADDEVARKSQEAHTEEEVNDVAEDIFGGR